MSLFKAKIFAKLFNEPIKTRQQLVSIIKQAGQNNIFDSDSLPLIEAVLQFGDMRTKDILLPRHEVDVIDLKNSMDEILQLIRRTGHSRFPVVDGSLNKVIGVFHSKDIVQYITTPEEFDLRDLLRQAVFVPDMKPLDSLLYEMRLKHSHLAIVVDEFTNVSGIVTLEMILEQIVGDIDDEHDSPDGEHGVVEIAHLEFRVKGYCGLEQFNLLSGQNWSDDKVESVGGYVSKHFGTIPLSGELIELNGCKVEITHADSRKINTLIVRLAK